MWKLLADLSRCLCNMLHRSLVEKEMPNYVLINYLFLHGNDRCNFHRLSSLDKSEVVNTPLYQLRCALSDKKQTNKWFHHICELPVFLWSCDGRGDTGSVDLSNDNNIMFYTWKLDIFYGLLIWKIMKYRRLTKKCNSKIFTHWLERIIVM